MEKILQVIIMVVVSSSGAKRYHSVAGPFHLVIKNFEQCPWASTLSREDGEPVNITIKGRRLQRHGDTAYTGQFYGPFELNSNIGVRIAVASWDPVSGWRDNAHVLRIDNICMTLEQIFKSLWISFLISMFGEELTCPYLAGIYKFSNVTLIKNDSPWKMFFYGKWRADIRVFRKSTKRECACLRLYADTVPA